VLDDIEKSAKEAGVYPSIKRTRPLYENLLEVIKSQCPPSTRLLALFKSALNDKIVSLTNYLREYRHDRQIKTHDDLKIVQTKALQDELSTLRSFIDCLLKIQSGDLSYQYDVGVRPEKVSKLLPQEMKIFLIDLRERLLNTFAGLLLSKDYERFANLADQVSTLYARLLRTYTGTKDYELGSIIHSKFGPLSSLSLALSYYLQPLIQQKV
jgi:hypothetical protein